MRNKGFTLLELMLVTVVVAVVLLLGVSYSQQKNFNLKLDRTTLQMQQILNASLAYYVNNGKWPASMANLSDGKYITPGVLRSPWGSDYTIENSVGGGQGIFTVALVVTTPTTANATTINYYNQIANMLAVRLPFGRVTAGAAYHPLLCSGATGTLVCAPLLAVSPQIKASVFAPGQDLNNATAVNFAGLYRHGGCIPVPSCPPTPDGVAMNPQVFVIPVSVSGVNDNTTTGTSPNVYPLSSFTAYATASSPSLTSQPPACSSASTIAPVCSGTSPTGNFWRACVDVVTERGNVASTRSDTNQADFWGQSVTLGAFTRCETSEELQGSELSIYSN